MHLLLDVIVLHMFSRRVRWPLSASAWPAGNQCTHAQPCLSGDFSADKVEWILAGRWDSHGWCLRSAQLLYGSAQTTAKRSPVRSALKKLREERAGM